ncbi:hypothetical protein EJ05DRAFT_477145 [Pseudovirgaria hyperparasitica]|uniref:Uncharacterized protein n=1 Tax=Pseudovirgaria hyperparasitica TaxID=470096 RepID=A0A6A6W2X9_9PEZI|nr:uncharacterized protein EJ05DRAFT_477145 [Pseudovirgaria hyperparasitica]KAF2756915.1 hypothetical protein EJ05DRAFT_477145 [Pseudovirgaria hyperparasitica]
MVATKKRRWTSWTSASLTESINSMYAWYNAAIVYHVYLWDIRTASNGIDRCWSGVFSVKKIFQYSQWYTCR